MKEQHMPDNCLLPPAAELHKGIDEFNAGAWFECHETLEELWVGERSEARDLYQGVLQVAAALHHWRNGNYRGAVRLLQTGSQLLSRVAPVCLDVDVEALLGDVGRFRERLESLGEEGMAGMGKDLIPRIRMSSIRGRKP